MPLLAPVAAPLQSAGTISATQALPSVVRLNTARPVDVARANNAELSLIVEYRVDRTPTALVTLGMNGFAVPVTESLRFALKANGGR